MATLQIICLLCILPFVYTQTGHLPREDPEKHANVKPQIPILEFRARRGACLEGSPRKSIQGLTVNDCQDACAAEVDFLCRSVEYKPSELQCDLREDSSKYTWYLNNCPRGSPGEWDLYEVVEGALWYAYTGSCIAMESKRVIQNMLLPDFCKLYCEDEVEFRCLAFNYNYMSGICELGADTRSTRALIEPCSRPGFDAYERTTFPHWKEWSDRRLNATSYETIHNLYMWDCLIQCWNNPALCNAFDFDINTRTCYLQTATTFTGNLLPAIGMDYYELFYRDERWRHYNEGCMSNAGGEGVTIPHRSMPGCLSACEMHYGPQHDFNCLSVNYRTTDGFCTLFNTTTNSQDQLFMTPCLEGPDHSFHEIMTCDGTSAAEAGIRQEPPPERAPWPRPSNRWNNRPKKEETAPKQKPAKKT